MRVSLHALSRYRERIETEDAGTDDDEIAGNILHALRRSRPVQLRSKRERIGKLLKHGAHAGYRQYQNMVMVIADGSVLSVYEYFPDRWQAVK